MTNPKRFVVHRKSMGKKETTPLAKAKLEGSPAPAEDPFPLIHPTPAPPAAKTIEDNFGSGRRAAFRFGFLGCGQGGGNVAAAFWKLGYRRVAVVNSTSQDMAALPPEIPRLNLSGGLGGAGKDMKAGAALARGKDRELFHLLLKAWGEVVDYGICCVGLGGGTGGGILETVLQAMRDYFAAVKLPPRVGAIVSLPSNFEGSRVAGNAADAFELVRGAQPLIVIDNQKVIDLYHPRMPDLYAMCDNKLTLTFHQLNLLAACDEGALTVFDRGDYATILDAKGAMILGSSLCTPAQLTTSGAISETLVEHLRTTPLATVDLRTAAAAAVVLLGTNESMDLDISAVDYALTAMENELNRERKDGQAKAVLHRGIYMNDGIKEKGLYVFSAIGGVHPPYARLRELAKRGGKNEGRYDPASPASFLGLD